MTAADRVLDARGTLCPIPVIRLGRVLAAIPEGSEVRLLATDPAALTDVPAFCRMRGHLLVEVAAEGGHTAYRVRKVTATAAEAGPAAPR